MMTTIRALTANTVNNTNSTVVNEMPSIPTYTSIVLLLLAKIIIIIIRGGMYGDLLIFADNYFLVLIFDIRGCGSVYIFRI